MSGGTGDQIPIRRANPKIEENVMQNIDYYTHAIAMMAQRAVLYEVTATPKPGLVDRYNSGAHKDMDFYTFMDSSTALYKGFFDCAAAGLAFEGSDLQDLLAGIRKPGIDCEHSMFEATHGINTHKGIIFSLGISCAAVGFLTKNKLSSAGAMSEPPALPKLKMEWICQTVSAMSKNLIEKDFQGLSSKPSKERTFGEKLYLTYGYKGIRGEVSTGFETVKTGAFASLRAWKQNPEGSKNELLLQLLLQIMISCEDSNVLHRGGIDGLVYVKRTAKTFVEAGGMKQTNAYERLEQMNRDFCLKNLSPGGAADLLSVAVFLGMAEGLV